MKTALGYAGIAIGSVGLAAAAIIAAPFVAVGLLLLSGVEPVRVTRADV
jgi:hypothetical protein